jgi:hypothetical protein
MPKIKQQQQREEEKVKLKTLGVCLPPGITVPTTATVPDNGRRDLVCSPPPPPLSWIYEHLIEFRFIFICRGLGSFRKLAIRRIQRANGKKPINGYVWEEVGRSRSSL